MGGGGGGGGAIIYTGPISHEIAWKEGRNVYLWKEGMFCTILHRYTSLPK